MVSCGILWSKNIETSSRCSPGVWLAIAHWGHKVETGRNSQEIRIDSRTANVALLMLSFSRQILARHQGWPCTSSNPWWDMVFLFICQVAVPFCAPLTDGIDGRNLPQLITSAAFRGRNLLALPMHLRVHRVLWKPPRWSSHSFQSFQSARSMCDSLG